MRKRLNFQDSIAGDPARPIDLFSGHVRQRSAATAASRKPVRAVGLVDQDLDPGRAEAGAQRGSKPALARAPPTAAAASAAATAATSAAAAAAAPSAADGLRLGKDVHQLDAGHDDCRQRQPPSQQQPGRD